MCPLVEIGLTVTQILGKARALEALVAVAALIMVKSKSIWSDQNCFGHIEGQGISTTGPYFFESVVPGPYMGGPYKMIMR
jgi:hypothetical protein